MASTSTCAFTRKDISLPNFPTASGDPAVDVTMRWAGEDVQLVVQLLNAAYNNRTVGKLPAEQSLRLVYIMADLQQWLTYYREGRLHVLTGKPEPTIKIADLPAPLRWLINKS